MRRRADLVMLFTSVNCLVAQQQIPQSFLTCIGPAGVGSTCTLPKGIYSVTNTLTIARSNITVMGTVVSTPFDTTLQRGSNISTLMTIQAGLSGVTIQDFAVDGNRYSPALGLNCLPGNPAYYDLNLSAAGTVLVQYVSFVNAPGAALEIGGDFKNGIGSVVRYSNFGMGSPSESAPQTATRATAIFLSGTQSGVWYDNIYYAGTAAINVRGNDQYVIGNQIGANRYEMPDGSAGGQLYFDPSSTYGSAAGNVINGNYWLTGSSPAAVNGCAVPANQKPGGVEGYGVGNRLYNNEVEQNTSNGVGFGGATPTNAITISGNNPFNSSDAPKYVETNGGFGIWVHDTNSSVILDHVRSRNNTLDGVNLMNTVTGEGFINNACLSATAPYNPYWPNYPGGLPGLQNPYPGSPGTPNYTSCP